MLQKVTTHASAPRPRRVCVTRLPLLLVLLVGLFLWTARISAALACDDPGGGQSVSYFLVTAQGLQNISDYCSYQENHIYYTVGGNVITMDLDFHDGVMYFFNTTYNLHGYIQTGLGP